MMLSRYILIDTAIVWPMPFLAPLCATALVLLVLGHAPLGCSPISQLGRNAGGGRGPGEKSC